MLFGSRKKFKSLYFNQFSDAILESKYPVHIKLLDSEKDSLYWCTHTGESLKNIPNCINDMGDLASFSDIEEAISYYYNSKSSVKNFYDRLVYNRNRWINEPLCPKKIYAYNFSVYCFFRIYLAFTAANVQPTLDLKISDLDITKIGSGPFAKAYKHRAGKNIHFTSSNILKRLLLKYLKLRSWLNDQDCIQDKNIDDYLFVSISKHKKIIRLLQSTGWSTMRGSPFFVGIKPISLRDIRNLAGEYVIKQSKGKLSLVAKKLNNTISTVARSYTSIDLESQAIEMNSFHEDLSLRIRQFNRNTDETIPINIIENANKREGVERIATGSCSNLFELNPMRAYGFNDNAPEPECGTFESCLFCKFFSLHIDFEDVHKILSLREALLKISSIRNDPEHFKIVVEPSIYRIDEIVKELQNKSLNTEKLVNEVRKAIKVGIYNDNWDKQIRMLEKQLENHQVKRGI